MGTAGLQETSMGSGGAVSNPLFSSSNASPSSSSPGRIECSLWIVQMWTLVAASFAMSSRDDVRWRTL